MYINSQVCSVYLLTYYFGIVLNTMNICDKKSVRCSRCDKFIGEIDNDASVVLPKCGKCANPLPEGDDKIQYIVNKFNLNPKKIVPMDSMT